MSRLYLGIDGGQSGTLALIGNEHGKIVGSGRGGPCNHVSTEEARARFFEAIGEALRQACGEAGLNDETVEFAAACFGLSGGAADKEEFARDLIRSKQYKFTHDAEIALTGALDGRPGIVVIAGTGSVAYGRNEKGASMRAGGWGYVFGDEGSGFDIARQAVRAALRFEEGWGPATALRTLLLEATEASDANDALHRLYTPDNPRSKIARWAALVDSAASAGDPVADEILRNAAGDLARLGKTIYSRLFVHGSSAAITYTGGVFRSRILLNAFCEAVQKVTGSIVEPPRLGPAAGALLEAMRLDENRGSLKGLPKSGK